MIYACLPPSAILQHPTSRCAPQPNTLRLFVPRPTRSVKAFPFHRILPIFPYVRSIRRQQISPLSPMPSISPSRTQIQGRDDIKDDMSFCEGAARSVRNGEGMITREAEVFPGRYPPPSSSVLGVLQFPQPQSEPLQEGVMVTKIPPAKFPRTAKCCDK